MVAFLCHGRFEAACVRFKTHMAKSRQTGGLIRMPVWGWLLAFSEGTKPSIIIEFIFIVKLSQLFEV